MKCPSLFLHIHSKSSSLFKTQLKSTFHCFLTVSCGLILSQPGRGSHLDRRCRFQLLCLCSHLPLIYLSQAQHVDLPEPLSPLVLRGEGEQWKVVHREASQAPRLILLPTNLLLILVRSPDLSQPQRSHLKTRIRFPISCAHKKHFQSLPVALSFN